MPPKAVSLSSVPLIRSKSVSSRPLHAHLDVLQALCTSSSPVNLLHGSCWMFAVQIPSALPSNMEREVWASLSTYVQLGTSLLARCLRFYHIPYTKPRCSAAYHSLCLGPFLWCFWPQTFFHTTSQSIFLKSS